MPKIVVYSILELCNEYAIFSKAVESGTVGTALPVPLFSLYGVAPFQSSLA